LFFPKTDSHTTALLSAFAFCSAFVFRPFGALIFGWIGDNIGRKTTVIITTMLMAVSCIVMANLPTYAQIGISAAWILTVCRAIQGISAMGEVIGAKIYLTETINVPARYTIVALMTVFSALGGLAALGVASLCTISQFNWRAAFWIGVCIAVVGSIARAKLRETPDFLKEKEKTKTSNYQGVSKKTALAYFFVQCGWPVCFYFAYVYCGNILSKTFGYTPDQVIHHNLIVSIAQVFGAISFVALSVWVHPLKILRGAFWLFLTFILICPYLLSTVQSPFQMFFVQCFIIFFGLGECPADAVFFKHFPVRKRFTSVSLIFSISRAFMFIITSFGLVYTVEFYGFGGILIIMLPLCAGYFWGINHFQNLDKEEDGSLAYTPSGLSSAA
jgi:predicted MFS family arabinose efflux permease